MDSIMNSASSYLRKMGSEVGDMAKELDGTGWAIVSVALLICGWFFLRGKKIKST
ncbi:MAG: hypothetical protein AAFN77_20000 [Planctomycetota bacterium]